MAGRNDWRTPRDLFDAVNREFRFDLDVAASADNALCPIYYSVADDALVQTWAPHVCWCNPPYSDEGGCKCLGKWLEKACREGQIGATVVCLVPSDTSTAWWHDWVARCDELRFLRGRVRFDGAKGSPTFASSLVIFAGRRYRSGASRFWDWRNGK